MISNGTNDVDDNNNYKNNTVNKIIKSGSIHRHNKNKKN